MSRRVQRIAPWIAALLLLAGPAAAAREVVVPLPLDFAFLRQALLAQMYTGADRTARVWDDGSGCNFLILSDPQLSAAAGRLRVRSAGRARVGTAIGERCLTLIDWSGTVEVDEEPTLDPALPVVRFRVVDSALYGEDGGKRVTGTIWDWVKSYVHPRLEAVTVDLAAPLDELRAVLPLVLPQATAEDTSRLLDSIALTGVRVTDAGLTGELRLAVADSAPSPPPEPTLTAEEIARWEEAWQRWDAFLTFVAKHTAADTGTEAQRQALFDVLIAARYDILEALRPTRPGEPDPVPALFVRTWTRLAPVVREVGLGLPGEAALRYLSFIAGADALAAIQQLGPGTGLDISADGLRRLARTIAPGAVEDPVAYSDAVDPVLRELFGFGAPLPPPEPNPGVDMSWVDPAPAWAGDLTARLNRWVPTRGELDQYLPLVRELLDQAASQTLARQRLDPRYQQIYRWLVPATAWKESCWRQFVREGGRILPIRSSAGALGMMQVNPRVWRGFYDVKGLGEDIGYNAGAGADIVLHYLRDYAIAKGEQNAGSDADNLARATYAAYNGGPGHLGRYRKSGTGKSLRQIDESFWDKYRKIKDGQVLAVAECYGS